MWIRLICRLIKQKFISILYFSGLLATKFISLNNWSFLAISNLLDLNPIELSYYQFMGSINKCNESCKTLDDAFGKICVPNIIENVNLIVFNMITKANETQRLMGHVSSLCKYKIDGRKGISNWK